jgi:predicted TIM-barrel fold metal-dependent hydrolase
MTEIIDIHPHIITDDEESYPPAPLFGTRSDWSKESTCTGDDLLAAMDAAGVAKAAVVHSSTTYGFDNSYVVDSCNRSDRLLAIGSVDLAAPDACATIQDWYDRGLRGLRIFTGGSTKDFDPSELENPAAFPAWELAGELGMPVCIQTGPVGLQQVRMLAERFSNVAIILDHLARPDILDGPPYANAQSLFDIADLANVYLKLTPRIFNDVKKGNASAETFFPRVVEAFGATRMAWGSNYPNSPGSLSDILATARAGLASLDEIEQGWIFGGTALTLYPQLATVPANSSGS